MKKLLRLVSISPSDRGRGIVCQREMRPVTNTHGSGSVDTQLHSSLYSSKEAAAAYRVNAARPYHETVKVALGRMK